MPVLYGATLEPNVGSSATNRTHVFVYLPSWPHDPQLQRGMHRQGFFLFALCVGILWCRSRDRLTKRQEKTTCKCILPLPFLGIRTIQEPVSNRIRWATCPGHARTHVFVVSTTPARAPLRNNHGSPFFSRSALDHSGIGRLASMCTDLERGRAARTSVRF